MCTLQFFKALRLPELKPVSLVAGRAGEQNRITSVNVMEVPDISAYVKEGDLLVTTMYPIRDQEQLQLALIPMLHSKGVAALAVAPLEEGRAIPDFMLAQAEALGLPLLALPYGTAFNAIINPILQIIVDRQTGLLKKNAEVNQRFLNVLIKGGSLAEIADMIHAEDGVPAAICSPLGSVLASAGEMDQDLLAACREQGMLKAGGTLELRDAGGKAALVWAYPVNYVQEHYATVFLFFREGRGLMQTEQEMVEQASNIIALEIARVRSQHTAEQRARASLMENILQGKIASLSQAVRMGKGCGWDLSGAFLPAVIRAGEATEQGPDARPREELIQGLQHTLDELARQKLRQPVISVGISGETLALFSVPAQDNTQQAMNIRSFLEEYTARFSGAVWAGLGRVASDVTQLPQAVKQAEKAARVAGLAANRHLVRGFDELGVFRVLCGDEMNEEQLHFMQDTLAGILRQKKESRNELLRTLRAYFASGCNLRQTAKDLFMHYNTIQYRVRRVEELLGIRLDDPEARLALQLAMKLLELYQG